MIAEFGQSLLHFIQAASAFNYQLISTLLSGLAEAWRAFNTLGGALSYATGQLLFYLWELSQELFKVAQTFIEVCKALGIVILQMLTIILTGLESVCICIASHLSSCLHWSYQNGLTLSEYVGLSAVDVKQVLVENTLTLARCIKGYALTIFNHLHSISIHTFKSFAQLLIYLRDQISVTAKNCHANCVHAYHDALSTLGFMCSYIRTNIPLDFYVWLVVILCCGYMLKCLIAYLSRKGLTLPSFTRGGTEIEIYVDDSDLEFVDSSADEDEEEEDEEEDPEVSDDSTGGSTSQSGENSSSDISEDDEDEDDVVEYEVDSTEDEEEEDEDEENDPNRINVQLPARTDYGLRSRFSPCPLSNEAKVKELSPRELERRLAHERDRRACVICQDAPKCVLVLPCRHMCMCVDCAHHVASTRIRQRRICPLCRAPIDTIMNVYL